MQFCPKCGKKISDPSMPFCGNCGASLANEVSEPIQTNTQYPIADRAQNSTEMPTNRKILIVGLSIFAFMFIVVLVANRTQSPEFFYKNDGVEEYNHTFTDSDGTIYDAVHNSKAAFGIIEIEKQKEIYCDFARNPKAKGIYNIVSFAVANRQNEPVTAGNIYLIDDKGRKYGDDSDAMATYVTMNNIDSLSLTQINPNESVIGVEIFDIPENVNIIKARLELFLESDYIEVPYKVSIK